MSMQEVRRGGRGYRLPALLVAGVVAVGLGYQITARLQAASPALPTLLVSAGSLRLMSAFGPQFAGEMLAARAGLFEREGLRIALEPGTGADDPIAAVASGTALFGATRADSFLLARGNGAPLVAFAAGTVESTAALYVLKQSGLRTPQDFVGHRVGRRAGDDTAVARL